MHQADHLGAGYFGAGATGLTGRVIWCLGVYASASTWLFNVIRQISIAAQPAPVVTRFVSGATDFRGLDKPAVTLIKSHEIADEATLIGVAGRADRIFITTRNPRDAVASLMQYHHHDFERALKLVEQASQLCNEFARDRRAVLFRYEGKFFEAAATVPQVARLLGYDITETAAQEIFDKLNREAIEKYIAGLPAKQNVLRDEVSGDFLDPQTHWHTHHAGRSGEIGRWRNILSESQAKEVELRCPL